MNQDTTSYIRIITRRWWLILLLPLVTVAVILTLSRTAETEYITSERLQIVVVDSQEVALFSQTRFIGSAEQIQAVHDEFFDVVRLRSVARRTIAQLGLNLSADELIARIDTQHANDFITVTLRMTEPQLAQQALGAHVENAISAYRDIRATPAQIVRDFVDAQLLEEGQVLADARRNLQKFQLENEVSDLDREILAYQDLRRSLRLDRERAVVEAERNDRLAAEFSSLTAANAAKAQALRATLVVSETVGDTATGEGGTAAAGQETAANEPEPDPLILSEIESLLALSRAQRSSAEQHTVTAAGHRAAISEYDRLLDVRQQELVYLLGLQERYNSLVSAVARAEANDAFLTAKANEATLKLAQGQDIGYLQVLEPPRLPDSAVPKRTLQLALVGVIISLLLAVILAFVLEVLERSLGGAAR